MSPGTPIVPRYQNRADFLSIQKVLSNKKEERPEKMPRAIKIPTMAALLSVVSTSSIISVIRTLSGPLTGFFNRAHTPKLHEEVYAGVTFVRDIRRADGSIQRELVISCRGGQEAHVLPHHHSKIIERFTVLSCEPGYAFLAKEERGKIAYVPVSAGQQFTAGPGLVHGFKVTRGAVKLAIVVEQFDPADIIIHSNISCS